MSKKKPEKLAPFALDSDDEKAVNNVKSSSKYEPFVSPIKVELEKSYDNLLDDLDEPFEESEEPKVKKETDEDNEDDEDDEDEDDEDNEDDEDDEDKDDEDNEVNEDEEDDDENDEDDKVEQSESNDTEDHAPLAHQDEILKLQQKKEAKKEPNSSKVKESCDLIDNMKCDECDECDENDGNKLPPLPPTKDIYKIGGPKQEEFDFKDDKLKKSVVSVTTQTISQPSNLKPDNGTLSELGRDCTITEKPSYEELEKELKKANKKINKFERKIEYLQNLPPVYNPDFVCNYLRENEAARTFLLNKVKDLDNMTNRELFEHWLGEKIEDLACLGLNKVQIFKANLDYKMRHNTPEETEELVNYIRECRSEEVDILQEKAKENGDFGKTKDLLTKYDRSKFEQNILLTINNYEEGYLLDANVVCRLLRTYFKNLTSLRELVPKNAKHRFFILISKGYGDNTIEIVSKNIEIVTTRIVSYLKKSRDINISPKEIFSFKKGDDFIVITEKFYVENREERLRLAKEIAEYIKREDKKEATVHIQNFNIIDEQGLSIESIPFNLEDNLKHFTGSLNKNGVTDLIALTHASFVTGSFEKPKFNQEPRAIINEEQAAPIIPPEYDLELAKKAIPGFVVLIKNLRNHPEKYSVGAYFDKAELFEFYKLVVSKSKIQPIKGDQKKFSEKLKKFGIIEHARQYTSGPLSGKTRGRISYIPDI